MALIDLSQKFAQIKQSAEQVQFTDVSLTDEFKSAYQSFITTASPNGYSQVEWSDYSTRIITSTGKSIFLTNYWFYIASELAGYLKGLAEQRDIFFNVFSGEDLKETAIALRNNLSSQHAEKIKTYFSDHEYDERDYDCFIKFVTDYSSWGGGKTIDRNDYYVSPLMQAGNLLAETQSAVAEIAKQFSENNTLLHLFEPVFSTKGIGRAVNSDKHRNLLSKDSRSHFVFDLVSFLFKNSLEAPLFNCCVEKDPEHGSCNLEYEDYRLTSFFKVSGHEIKQSELMRSGKLRFFESPFFHDSKYYYLSNQWTDGTDSRLDIQTLISLFNSIYDDYEIVSEEGTYFLRKVAGAHNIKIPKPFLLLAGISGTGKTRFVRKQAQEHSMDGNNFCLVSVRPDWHEPSDLLGYISRIDGTKYVATKALKFIVEAWKTVAPNASKTGMGDLDLSSVPYWLCLDEMNLAPVEQYFADYLSVLESREFNGGEYNCDALLDKTVLESVPAIQDELGLQDDVGLWEYFSEHGISLPPNLIVAGTVNMDETTHGFSRKVIDRALSIDFGKFYPNDYDTFFAGQALPKTLTYSTKTHADKALLENTCDPEGDKTKSFLKNINEILNNTPFELAYRALNELFLFVSAFAPKDEETLQAVWDDFLMTKVLPRIDGDEDKLRSTKKGDNSNILDQLESFLSNELGSIWDKTRVDLLRSDKDGNDIKNISCRSKEKIEWMKDRLEKNTFTSYWP